MSWGVCGCLSQLLQGPSPPCPLSLERLLSGSLAFRFKLNHKDESSLFFLSFFLSLSFQPTPISAPFLSSVFPLKGGREHWDECYREREVFFVMFLVWGQKTPSFYSQIYRRKPHAKPQMGTRGYESPQLFLLSPRTVTHKNTPTAHQLPTFLAHQHPSIPPCAPCCLLDLIPWFSRPTESESQPAGRESCPYTPLN